MDWVTWDLNLKGWVVLISFACFLSRKKKKGKISYFSQSLNIFHEGCIWHKPWRMSRRFQSETPLGSNGKVDTLSWTYYKQCLEVRETQAIFWEWRAVQHFRKLGEPGNMLGPPSDGAWKPDKFSRKLGATWNFKKGKSHTCNGNLGRRIWKMDVGWLGWENLKGIGQVRGCSDLLLRRK